MIPAIRVGISILVFLCAWELVGRSGFVHISLFPPPSMVAAALWEMANARIRWPADCCTWLPRVLEADLYLDIGVSLWRAVVGWLIGSASGIMIGLLTGRVERIRDYIAPIINVFRPLPPVAIIPVVIVWFGIGEVSKLFSIAFAVFFPVWINTHVGSQRIPQSFLWSAKTLKVGRSAVLFKVIFPSALPFIIAGLRTGVALSFVMVYVSELAGASAGIGYEISTSHLAYRVDRMLGALFVLGLLGALADLAVTRTLRLIFPWLRYAEQK